MHYAVEEGNMEVAKLLAADERIKVDEEDEVILCIETISRFYDQISRLG